MTARLARQAPPAAMAAAAASTAGGVGSQLISGRFHSPLHTAGATRRGPDACGCSTLAAPLPRLCSVGYYVKKADCAPCSLPSCLDCAMCTPDTSGCIDGRQCTLCNTGHYRKLGKCEKASGNQLGRAAAAVHSQAVCMAVQFQSVGGPCHSHTGSFLMRLRLAPSFTSPPLMQLAG